MRAPSRRFTFFAGGVLVLALGSAAAVYLVTRPSCEELGRKVHEVGLVMFEGVLDEPRTRSDREMRVYFDAVEDWAAKECTNDPLCDFEPQVLDEETCKESQPLTQEERHELVAELERLLRERIGAG